MKKLSLVTKILIGLALGIIAGLLLQNHVDIANTYIKPFGTLFLNLLKMKNLFIQNLILTVKCHMQFILTVLL